MALDRTNWAEVFERDHFPTFPCPRCDHGGVAVDKATLRIEEPAFSKQAHGLDGWEPDWVQERFSLALRCIEASCGEVVLVSGETQLTETFDDEAGWGFVSALKPKSMFPAPPIIQIPEGAPIEVTGKIDLSFGHFWFDLGASANCLRTSVEALLDHLKVPTTAISKKTGKSHDLDLNGRIQFYEKNNPDHGETFHALRVVGNLGSHGSQLSREAILDAFEIYEDALADVVGGKKAYLAAIKKKIIATKGKY